MWARRADSCLLQITDLQQEVRRAHSLIQIIGSLRDRLLAIPSADSPVAIEVLEDLDGQTTAARSLFTSIQTRLHELEQGNANLRVLIPAGQSSYDLSLHDVDIRQQQVSLLKERFKEVIQRYAAAEQEHRAKQRVRLERQIRVVNPSLPPEEMQEVIDRAEAGENPAIFAQAVGAARSWIDVVCSRSLASPAPDYRYTKSSRPRSSPRSAEPCGRARSDRADVDRACAALSRRQSLLPLLSLLHCADRIDANFDRWQSWSKRKTSSSPRSSRRRRRSITTWRRASSRFRSPSSTLGTLASGAGSAALSPQSSSYVRVGQGNLKPCLLTVSFRGQVIVAVVLCAVLIPPALRARRNNSSPP